MNRFRDVVKMIYSSLNPVDCINFELHAILSLKKKSGGRFLDSSVNYKALYTRAHRLRAAPFTYGTWLINFPRI